MLLQPKRPNFNKSFSRKKISLTKKNHVPNLGDFSLVASESGKVTNRQLEAVRRLLRRLLKKQARIWICAFPWLPITKKPQETRQGKGKGATKYWVCPIRTGQALFEVKGCDSKVAFAALSLAKNKLSVKTKYFSRNKRWIF